METVGFAVNVLGLAGLYSVALQGMELITDWTTIGSDLQKIHCMLEAEKYLLEKWGDRTGVNVDGSVRARNHPALNNPRTCALAFNIMANIENIVSDADTLSDKYGLEHTPVPIATLQAAHSRIQQAGANTRGRAWYRLKFVWAVKDKSKFKSFVDELRVFIETLHLVVPPNDGNEMAGVTKMLKKMRLSMEGILQVYLEQWYARLC